MLMDSEVAEVRQVLASVATSEVVDSIDDDDLFFADRVIDSLHLIEIIDEFESRFGIAVEGSDLSPENFGSIAGMARFLRSRRGTTGAPR
jgi:acyl carrier protein